MLTLSTTQANWQARFWQRLSWSETLDHEIERSVAAVLQAVKSRGDSAVLEYTQRWDGLQANDMADLYLGPDALAAAFAALPAVQQQALRSAAERIRAYHTVQLQHTGLGFQYTDDMGNVLGQQVTPLDKVGIYVPGGRAAYPSSVLMNAIPAQVAGVRDILMVVPTPRGQRNALVLAAAHVAGVPALYTIGGAQAIAALAYGTQSIAAVDKITGPGNAWVAAAKRRVFGQVGIDMIAGPSEILVLADGSTPAQWVAMDLLSQAEHDELAQSILLCPDAAYIQAVQAALDSLVPSLPRAAIVRASLAHRGLMVHTRDMQEACELANRIAPEHLELACQEPQAYLPALRHAGAIFLGAWTSESLGDYCAGPNHVLPTSRTARFASALGVYDFQKRSSIIQASATGAQQLGIVASTLAHGEGLHAHARAAQLRMQALDSAPGPTAQSLQPRQHCDLAVSKPQVPSALQRIRADVRAMPVYHVADARGLIKLDAMENPYTLSATLQTALAQRLAALALNRYPAQGPEQLALALQRHLQLPSHCRVLLGNGSDEWISLLALACARLHGHADAAAILAPQPSFVMYAVSAALQGLRYVWVDLQSDFSLDVPAMVQAITSTSPALLFLASPNNPCGSLWPVADIQTLVQTAAQQGSIVVLDEAYAPFAGRSWAQCIGQHGWEHVLLLRTFSKLGLAGARIGYLAGPSLLLDALDKVRPPYNVSSLDAECGLFALEHQAEFTAQAALICQARAQLHADLSALLAPFGDARVFPSAANMLLLRLPASHGADTVFAALKARGILIKNVSHGHHLLRQCLRITVGTPAENAQLLQALANALALERR